MKPFPFVMSIALAFLCSPCFATDRDDAGKAHALLEQLMQEEDLPSVSAAVGVNGSIVYAEAFGEANLELDVDATPQTVYPIGSVSKTLTAVTALRLAEEGRLDLDKDVRSYCKAFPQKGHEITSRQLLAHTAGIRHYDYRRFEEDFLNRRHFDTIADALKKFADDPLVSDLGEQYHYSSWGYVLLGCAVEGAGGASYADLLKTRVLQPAGMTRTQLDDVSVIIPGRAAGYSRSKAGELVNAGLFDPSDRYPAGGLSSTPSDLVRFGNALLAGELLDEKSLDAMWSTATLASGEPTKHGLGWELSESGDAVSHGGTSVGATSYLYIEPENRLVVALIVNQTFWTKRREEIATRLAGIFRKTP